LFDHIGGLNTLFNALSMGATVIIPDDREPDYIGSLIEKHEITLLPTSPTFLNLMLISETYKNYDLSSLKLITYGTEPMPESLLRRLRKVFPRVRFLQTYGTTETGIATTSSKSSDSLYMKIDDPHIQWKVVDGELWLKSDAQMLGYINYNDPFVENGWFPTGDIVEVIEDSYIKIVGRENEIINVGGQKVFPAEVENVILELDVVLDAVVYGEDNPITGQIVTAEIILMNDVDKDDLVKRIKFHCMDRLEKYKRPIKFKIVDRLYYGTRFKKKRSYGG
jgi:acyl-coenzyme A synthetase/AMP-(fatty) acid ligase